MRGRIATLACMLMVAPLTARATTGGPTWLVPLGYDPVHQRVYWRYETSAETDDFMTRVYFLDLGGKSTSIGVLEGHPAVRLVPLVEHPGPVLVRRPRVIATDRVRVAGVPVQRYRLGVLLPPEVHTQLEVVAFDSAAVAITRDFEIPGRREHLFVVAFMGDPNEETYETQLPVLWPFRTSKPILEWKLPRR